MTRPDACTWSRSGQPTGCPDNLRQKIARFWMGLHQTSAPEEISNFRKFIFILCILAFAGASLTLLYSIGWFDFQRP